MADGVRLDMRKFKDPSVTAKGETRAHVDFAGYRTLWFNTGTLCNITCAGCYIESSPVNDRLSYLTPDDIAPFLDELAEPIEIGFTGGEPFLNPHMPALIEAALARGHRVLVLTNAMRPMMRPAVQAALLKLRSDRLTLRVSLDAPEQELHDAERGKGAYAETLAGIDWLIGEGFHVAIAGRLWGHGEEERRAAFAALFAARGWNIDSADPGELVLFPEMDETADVPEISTACWGILNKSPQDVMCATSRMIVKRTGADKPVVLACTLIPYDTAFQMGATLAEAQKPVSLNHPHCAKFCVLGGGKCAV
jgi:MoaA/NifB/PqqE/SkfB family radical SAM enzyme